MKIDELLERSATADDITLSHIACAQSQEELVPVHTKNRIVVEPVWEKQVGSSEGPLYRAYIKERPAYSEVYVRKSVRKLLHNASQKLPDGLSMVIRAGHRPIEVQLKLLNGLISQYVKKHPGTTRDAALEYARTYVSDPSLKLPPHCCGAAVDVDLFNTRTNKLVDFGCSVNTDGEIATLDSPLVNARQRKNRMTLATTMLEAGFASYHNEWWHYSFGDQLWAFLYKIPKSLYGTIEPKL